MCGRSRVEKKSRALPQGAQGSVTGLGEGSLFTTFLGGVLLQGEQLLLLSALLGLFLFLSGVQVRLSSLSFHQSILSKEALSGCKDYPCQCIAHT